MSVPPCPWCQAKPMTVRAAHGRSERTFCPACYRVAVTVGGECNSRERWSEAVAEILEYRNPPARNTGMVREIPGPVSETLPTFRVEPAKTTE